MNTGDQQEVQRLLSHIPFGKANAIHATDLAKKMGYPTGHNQVELRHLIHEAIQLGNIILCNTRVGYWRSNSKQEVQAYINTLNRRADEIYGRSNKIQQAWNQAHPNNTI